MRPGHVEPVLVHVAVDDEVDELGPDAGVVEERAALGGGAVGRDALPLALQPVEQRGQLRTNRLHPVAERCVVRQVGEALLALGLEERPRGILLVRGTADPPAQGAAVQAREVLDRVEVQPVAAHQGVDRRAREVAEVLVVDRVELAVVDQVADVGVLDRGDAVVREQDRDALHEAVESRHVRHHVVGDDHVGARAGVDEPPRQVGAEELAQGRHAGGLRRVRLLGRRVDAEHRHALLDEVAQQVAVVAGELDDEAVAPEAPFLDQPQRVLARVAQQPVGERREVEVVVDEELVRLHLLEDLHERAGRAERDVERKARLGPASWSARRRASGSGILPSARKTRRPASPQERQAPAASAA